MSNFSNGINNGSNTPVIYQTTDANRPTAPLAIGSLFVSQTSNILQRWDGSGWVTVGGSGTGSVVSVNGQTGVVVLTTTDIAEGTNLYYTDARARAALSAGSGISYNSTTGAIANSGVLSFNGNTGAITYTAPVTSVNGQTGAVTLTTTNIAEGTNLYYTDGRARAALSGGTGVTYNSTTGVIAIGQSVATSATPIFAGVQANSSSGLLVYNSAGTLVATFGSANTTNTSVNAISGTTATFGFFQTSTPTNNVGATFQNNSSSFEALQIQNIGSGIIQTWKNNSGTVAAITNAGLFYSQTLVVGATSLSGAFIFESVGTFPALFNSPSTANSATFGGVVFYRATNTVNNGNGIAFNMNNSANNRAEYAYIGCLINTNTTTAENGSIYFGVSNAGSRTEAARLTTNKRLLINRTADDGSSNLQINGGAFFSGGYLNINMPNGNSLVGTLTGTGTNVGAQWKFVSDNNTTGAFIGISAGESSGDAVFAVGANKKLVFGIGLAGTSRAVEIDNNSVKIFQSAGNTSNWVSLGASGTGTNTWLFGAATTGSSFTLKTDAYLNVTHNGTAFKIALIN